MNRGAHNLKDTPPGGRPPLGKAMRLNGEHQERTSLTGKPIRDGYSNSVLWHCFLTQHYDYANPNHQRYKNRCAGLLPPESCPQWAFDGSGTPRHPGKDFSETTTKSRKTARRIHTYFKDIGGADDLVLPKRETTPLIPLSLDE